jgi:hypothetical protein
MAAKGGKRAGAGRPEEPLLKDKFLVAFAESGVIGASCRHAGIDRKTYRNWMLIPEFVERFKEAEQDAIDNLEAEMRRRAVEGTVQAKFNPKTGKPYRWTNPVTGKTEVYLERVYSDTLLLRLAESRAPERFSPRQKLDVSELDDSTLIRLYGLGRGGAPETGTAS